MTQQVATAPSVETGTRLYGFAIALAVAMAGAAVSVSLLYDVPLRDPDWVVGPTYLRLPAIVGACFLTVVLPRAIRRAADLRGFGAAFSQVVGERWRGQRLQVVAIGLVSWYVTYVAFRNLKSFLPLVRDGIVDSSFASFDRALTLGEDPAGLLHRVLGTDVAAHLFSTVYIAWLVFIPVSLAAALVWTRDAARGAWYLTAVSVDWVLGVIVYYLFPTVGPIYADPAQFADLSPTFSSRLATGMLNERAEVIADPHATSAVQNIAAFASLHVAITVTAVLIAKRVGLAAWVRRGLWGFLWLTVLATVYLGWHYLLDAVGGVVIGAVAMWVGALATGNDPRGRPPQEAEHVSDRAATSASGAS